MLGYEISWMAALPYEEWSTSSKTGEDVSHSHWSDMQYFVESGGSLMQNLLFRAMIESMDCINVPIPALRGPTHSRVARNTRLRARWAAKAKREAIQEDREWLRDNFIGMWKNVFKSDPNKIFNWMLSQWPECDKSKAHSTKVKRMLVECLRRDRDDVDG